MITIAIFVSSTNLQSRKRLQWPAQRGAAQLCVRQRSQCSTVARVKGRNARLR
jgi:hypothetical protein